MPPQRAESLAQIREVTIRSREAASEAADLARFRRVSSVVEPRGGLAEFSGEPAALALERESVGVAVRQRLLGPGELAIA